MFRQNEFDFTRNLLCRVSSRSPPDFDAKTFFEEAAFTVKRSAEDAYVLITLSSTAVFVVGEEIDLLVLLTALLPTQSNV